MGNKVTAWSFSRYERYDKCALNFKFSVIDKVPVKVEESYHLQRGNLIHAKGESFVNGKIIGVPKEFKEFQYEMKQLKRLGADTEKDYSITKAWKPTHTKDWNGVWCRAFLDVSYVNADTALVIDYKSGKMYALKHREQGSVYAATVFAHHPMVKKVRVEFWYVDSGEVLGFTYYRDEYMGLRKTWEQKVKPMFTDTKFKPNPSAHNCKYCDFHAKNSGPCKYGV